MNNIKNKKVILGIATALLIVAAFFAGKSYGSGHPKAGSTQNAQNGMTASGGFNRGGMPGGGAAGGFAGRGGVAGGVTMGQVVSKDANSITVSITGGGSKIILYSPSTTISKSATGAIGDVAVGSTVTAIGSANSDGSIAATSIQIRPAGTAPIKQ